MNSLKTSVKLPRRTSVTECVSDMAQGLREQLKKKIVSEAQWFCTTTDIWTSRALVSFISFTVHYLTEEFESRSWNLEVRKLSGKHTGERICHALQSICLDWNISLHDMALMVRDNASNGKVATDLLGVDSLGCIPHTIHLVQPSFLSKGKSQERGTQQ